MDDNRRNCLNKLFKVGLAVTFLGPIVKALSDDNTENQIPVWTDDGDIGLDGLPTNACREIEMGDWDMHLVPRKRVNGSIRYVDADPNRSEIYDEFNDKWIPIEPPTQFEGFWNKIQSRGFVKI